MIERNNSKSINLNKKFEDNALAALRPIPTRDEVLAAINPLFIPAIEQIEQDKEIAIEYYTSGLSLTKFAIKKNVSWEQMKRLLKRYELTTRFSQLHSNLHERGSLQLSRVMATGPNA